MPVLGLMIVAAVYAAPVQRPVHAEDLPPDDGAPPSDYVPVDGSGVVGPESPDDALVLEDPIEELPSSPPIDNAFPIRGLSRSSCVNSFGDPRGGGRTHMGVDCFAPIGTPLVAVESGTIRYATPGEPFSCPANGDISGNRVSVRGQSGYVYYYGHLDTILVETDQVVEKGQVIGTVGRTGNASCSTSHLHIEVKCGENGDPFDPYPLLASWGRVTLPPTPWPSTEGNGVGVAYSGGGREDLYTLECGLRLRQKTLRSGQDIPGDWTALAGATVSDPDGASPAPGSDPHLFVRGSDNALYQRYLGNWFSFGGTCTSGPTAAFSGPDELHVFCRGVDNAIWQRIWTSAVGWWGPWFRPGGVATSDPDAASPGPGQPAQVFVRGTDDAMWHMFWNGSGWQFYNVGGVCTSGPSAVYTNPGRLDVFCRGTDMRIWHRWWFSSLGWSPVWEPIGGRQSISAPEAAASGSADTPQVFFRGVDRKVYQYVYDGSAWVSRDWGLT